MSKRAERQKAYTKIAFDMDKFAGSLERFPFQLRQQAFTTALRKAGNVVKSAAKPNVPVGETGNLKKSITVQVKRYQDDKMFLLLVGPSWPAGAHGYIVEHGHNVFKRGKKGQSLKNKEVPPDSGKAYVEGVKFMAPAIDGTRSQQEKAVLDELEKQFQKLMKNPNG